MMADGSGMTVDQDNLAKQSTIRHGFSIQRWTCEISKNFVLRMIPMMPVTCLNMDSRHFDRRVVDIRTACLVKLLWPVPTYNSRASSICICALTWCTVGTTQRLNSRTT